MNLILFWSTEGVLAVFACFCFLRAVLGYRRLERKARDPALKAAQRWGAGIQTTSTQTVGEPSVAVPVEQVTRPLVGWRVYQLGFSELEPLLIGGNLVQWPTATASAECRMAHIASACHSHLLNGICTCGIYGMKSPIRASGNFIAARCLFGGVVVEGEYGYRAELVRIMHLWVVSDRPRQWLLESLRERYGVEVEPVSHAEWSRLCALYEQHIGEEPS